MSDRCDPDVQAAVTVVGRREARRDFLAVNRSDADLPAQTFTAQTSAEGT